MDDLVIELILIAMILVPAIATSLQPAKVANRTLLLRPCSEDARRGN